MVGTSGARPGRKDREAGRGQIYWDKIHPGSRAFWTEKVVNEHEGMQEGCRQEKWVGDCSLHFQHGAAPGYTYNCDWLV